MVRTIIYYLKIIYLFIRSNIYIIIYPLGALSYYLSLYNLERANLPCYKYRGLQCLYFLAKLVFISSLLISYSIYLIIFKKQNKKHLIIILLIFIYFYLIDHNSEIVKHGLYNFIAFIISTILLFLLIIILHSIYNLFIKKRYSIILFIICLLIYCYYISKSYKSKHFLCNNWTKGQNLK